MNSTVPPTIDNPPSYNFLNISGYSAIDNPYLYPGYKSERTLDQIDAASLLKLHETGFDVNSLQEAHDRFKISPIRTIKDIYTLMGHKVEPLNPNNTKRYTEEALTSLAIQYPNPRYVGTTFEYSTFIRLRYPKAVKRLSKNGDMEDLRYEQPSGQKKTTTSEPYFLVHETLWAKLQDTNIPLFITEGELKAASLALAGYAAIGWGGATNWMAPKKAGKNHIHPALDPDGPRSKWAIPVRGRQIYLIPDNDYVSNQMVRRSFLDQARAYILAGSQPPKIIHIPQPDIDGDWKGIDDYIRYHVGVRWSSDPARMEKVKDVVNGLVNEHFEIIRSNDIRYVATSITRGSDRMIEYLKVPDRFTNAVKLEDSLDTMPKGWLMYDKTLESYRYIDITPKVAATYSRTPFVSVDLSKVCIEIWERGVDDAIREGDIEGRATEMASDYPYALVHRTNLSIESRKENTLIEPFSGVAMGDDCIRIEGALVNLNTVFNTEGDLWDNRRNWLIAPNYRWFSNGHLHVSLSQIPSRPEMPEWIKFLENIFDGDQESVRVLQKWFGKVICSPKFVGMQQFLALYGAAGAGKGTITRVLEKLLGSELVDTLRATFEGRFDGNTLAGKRLLVFPEAPDDGSRFKASMADLIKSITGQDRIKQEKKGKDAFDILASMELMTVSNTPPVIPMEEGAYRRRVVFLKAINKIAEQDFRVEERIKNNELPAIFLWGLEGARSLYRGEKFRTPEICVPDLTEVLEDVSPETRFVRTEMAIKPGNIVTLDDIIERYASWREEKHLAKMRDTGARKIGRIVREVWGADMIPDHKLKNGRYCRAFVGVDFVNQTEGVSRFYK